MKTFGFTCGELESLRTLIKEELFYKDDVHIKDDKDRFARMIVLEQVYEKLNFEPEQAQTLPDGILCRRCGYVGSEDDYPWREDCFSQRFIECCPRCESRSGFIHRQGGRKIWVQG